MLCIALTPLPRRPQCFHYFRFAILLLRIDQPSQSLHMFDARKTFKELPDNPISTTSNNNVYDYTYNYASVRMRKRDIR